MPIHQGSDTNGSFYQWGQHGKKYYFTDEQSKITAHNLAMRQARAIFAKKYK
jgi:hypothetical protein